MFVATTPDVLSPSWVNQGGASETTTNKALVLNAPISNGVQVRVTTISMGATTTLVAAFRVQLTQVTTNSSRCGIGIQETANGGDLQGIWAGGSDAEHALEIGHYTSPTGTFGSDLNANVGYGVNTTFFVKIVSLGSSNFSWSYSTDGNDWTAISTSLYRSINGDPVNWFYGCDNNQASYATGGAAFITLLHWNAT
jgi:hypothetical protein